MHEFDFAMWGKDCELKSFRKQLEAKPAAEKVVPIVHFSGANNVIWPVLSSTVELLCCSPIKLLQFFLNMELLMLVMLSLHLHGTLSSVVHNQQGSHGHLIRYPIYLLCHSVQGYLVLCLQLVLQPTCMVVHR